MKKEITSAEIESAFYDFAIQRYSQITRLVSNIVTLSNNSMDSVHHLKKEDFLKKGYNSSFINLFNVKINDRIKEGSKFKIDFFHDLYLNSNYSKKTLVDNLNKITHGDWKNNIHHFFDGFNLSNKDTMDIILSFNSTTFSINKKNLKTLSNYLVHRKVNFEDEKFFWLSFFTNRKNGLNSNASGSVVRDFLSEKYFRKNLEDFKSVSLYVNDLFENKIDFNCFSDIGDNHLNMQINLKDIEKKLAITNFPVKIISSHLDFFFKELKDKLKIKRMHYTYLQNTSEACISMSSNEVIDNDYIKKKMQNYCLFLKEEPKAREKLNPTSLALLKTWWLKNELDGDLKFTEKKQTKILTKI